MKHALVVGGTGMLSGVVLWLLSEGYRVSVIARSPLRMEKLMEKTNVNSVTPILVDYKNDDVLQTKVKSTIEKNGDIDIVVAWIHSNAPDALKIIVKEVSINQKKWELIHVLGSGSDIEKIKKEVTVPKRCFYCQVRLGFVMEGGRSRWLTDEEISNGVIKAINNKKKALTIGQIEPWESRP